MANMNLQIVLSAVDKTKGAFRDLDNSLKKVSTVSAKTARNLKLIGVAATGMAVAIGKKSVDAAVEFEASMANVSTLIDTNVESMDDMKKAVLEISKDTPVAINELTEALYDTRSAGIEAGEAMSVLKSSAKLAVGGLGTTKEATTLMTLAMNNFRDSGLSADEVANIMFKTVKGGITTVAQLSQSFGLVAPLAQAAGISLEELQAVTASLTQVNKSASVSQNSIKASLISLGKPTKDAMDLFDKLGVETFPELIEKSGSYVGALRALEEATDGDVQAFARAIGSGEALSAVTALLGAQSEVVVDVMKDMKGGSDALTEAYDKQNEATEKQFQLLKNKLNTVMVDLGVKIIPLLLTGIENTMMILGEWKIWIIAVADAFGTVINKARLAQKWLNSAGAAVKKYSGYDFLTGAGRGEANIKGIPFFDRGGIVPGPIGSPQLINAHGGETVLPTHKSGYRGGATVTVNIMGGNYLDREAGRMFAEYLGQKMKNELRI